MSCSDNYMNPDKKPKDTKTKTYIWKEVKDNPNLYCWIPVDRKKVNIDYDPDETILFQDIPPVSLERITEHSKEIIKNREEVLLKKLLEGKDSFSIDDPRKYKITKKFIKQKGLKVYGGYALNEQLPKNLKIYSESQLPDFDVYSPDPWNDAIELGEILYNSGFRYIEIRAGVHLGTYKVYINLWPVIDITYMPKDKFEKIKYDVKDGLKIVNLDYIRAEMYKEMSVQNDPSRWPKIKAREIIIDMWKPQQKIKCPDSMFIMDREILKDPIFVKLLKITSIFTQKFIHVGPWAINSYMEVGGSSFRLPVSYYDCFVGNTDVKIKNLFDKLVKVTTNIYIQTVNNIYFSDYSRFIYSIYYIKDGKEYLVCSLRSLQECLEYKTLFRFNIASINLLKYVLYSKLSVSYDEEVEMKLKCILSNLISVQKSYYKNKNADVLSKDNPFQIFVKECKGPVKNTLKHSLLQKWINRIDKKLLQGECNREKEDCTHPCYWDKTEDRCRRIPQVYRVDIGDKEY